MKDGIHTNPPGGTKKLEKALRAYGAASGKTGEAVMVQKGAQLLLGNSNPKFGPTFKGLVQLFRAQQPRRGEITKHARARGWRLGRITAEARQRAERKLGGFDSILANVLEDEGTGKITLRGVRRGKKGGRITGGRRGLGGFAVGGRESDLRQDGDVRLNFQAVATIEELNMREGARGFLGAAFLFKRWRKLAASDPRRSKARFRELRNENPRSRIRLLGSAKLQGDGSRGQAGLRITSHVPATKDVGEQHNLFGRAMQGVTADLDRYLARQEDKTAIELFKKTGLPVR